MLAGALVVRAEYPEHSWIEAMLWPVVANAIAPIGLFIQFGIVCFYLFVWKFRGFQFAYRFGLVLSFFGYVLWSHVVCGFHD